MNRKVTEAVERLFSACLEASLTGKCQAHISYSPNANMVVVIAYPIGTDFIATPQPTPLFQDSVLLGPILGRPFDDALVADRVRKLDRLTERLHDLKMQEAA
ncbi:hypothetical protein [Azotobacter vinelandii]|uniref:hypothetical protein n=1 Tax=Azotobacter vinelandii TaxID=354 RepID=UPI00091224E6|nr:hypothetical protein [Azotobacter vinelandii]SFY33020.1 hypothetical protein SAMN04244547_05137 [Azotobacter vinelandii]